MLERKAALSGPDNLFEVGHRNADYDGVSKVMLHLTFFHQLDLSTAFDRRNGRCLLTLVVLIVKELLFVVDEAVFDFEALMLALAVRLESRQIQQVLVALHLLCQLFDHTLQLLDQSVSPLDFRYLLLKALLEQLNLLLGRLERDDQVVARVLLHAQVVCHLLRLSVELAQALVRFGQLRLKRCNFLLVAFLRHFRNRLFARVFLA